MAQPHHSESSPSATAFPASRLGMVRPLSTLIGQAAHELALPDRNEIIIDPVQTSFRGSIVSFDVHYHAATDPRQNPLALLKGGILTDNDRYSEAANELADLGWTVANIDPSGTLPLNRALAPAHLRDPLRRQSQTIWAAMRYLREDGYAQPFNLIGHSKGGPEVLGAAIHHPEEVSTVLLVEPATMGHGSAEVASDFMLGILLDLTPAAFRAWRQGRGIEHAKGALHRVGRHSVQIGHDIIGLVGRDDRAAGKTYIENGGKIIVRFGENDRIFHPGKYMNRAREMTDAVGVMPALGHGAFQFQPKATAEEIDMTLRASMSATDKKPVLSVVS